MPYVKKVVCPRSELPDKMRELLEWRGPKTGRPFRTISIYFFPHPKALCSGLAEGWALIIARC